jgi:hypothetical protein
MRDDSAPPDPLGSSSAEADEAALRDLVHGLTLREHRRQAAQTTDQDGLPLPRLDLADPHPVTDDPLLRVGYALRDRLAGDWLTATLMVSAAADEVRTWAMVTRPAAGPQQYGHLLYLPEIATAAAGWRRASYEPHGRGAWYGVTVRLNANGTLVAELDYDGPPFLFWGPNEVDLLRRDHELYPRPPGRLPAWHPAR